MEDIPVLLDAYGSIVSRSLVGWSPGAPMFDAT